MKLEFLGDSYDLVRQCLLRSLASLGPWATHPMFTEFVSPEMVDAHDRFLGTRVLSREILARGVDRHVCFAPACECDDHVFLDPDTGIRLAPTEGKRAPAHVFGPELVAVARARPKRSTLVFDQSLARGAKRGQLEDKLSFLADHGLHAIACVSHACFVLVGADHSLVDRAFEDLERESRWPGERFLRRSAGKKAKPSMTSGDRCSPGRSSGDGSEPV